VADSGFRWMELLPRSDTGRTPASPPVQCCAFAPPASGAPFSTFRPLLQIILVAANQRGLIYDVVLPEHIAGITLITSPSTLQLTSNVPSAVSRLIENLHQLNRQSAKRCSLTTWAPSSGQGRWQTQPRCALWRYLGRSWYRPRVPSDDQNLCNTKPLTRGTAYCRLCTPGSVVVHPK
jgi:hypothetical protein